MYYRFCRKFRWIEHFHRKRVFKIPIFSLLFNMSYFYRFLDSWIFSCGQSTSGSSTKRLLGFKILLLLAASLECHHRHRGTAIGYSGCGRVQPAVFVKKVIRVRVQNDRMDSSFSLFLLSECHSCAQ